MKTEFDDISKKPYIIAISVVILLFIILYFLFTNVTITLNGSNPLVLEYGNEYEEPGFSATNGFGKDVTKDVLRNGTIDEYQEGYQTIEYIYNFGGIKKKVTRDVVVLENPFKEYNFVINGDKKIYLTEGSVYEELGAYVLKIDTNSLFTNIDIDSSINVFVPGEYDVIYSFTEDGNTMHRKRKVIILENNEQIVSSSDGKSGTIKIDFSSIDDYTKTILPDGKETIDSKISFKINSNGEYHFLVYSGEKQIIDKKVVVEELSGSLMCIGKVRVSGTYLNLLNDTPSISKLIWNADEEKYEGTREIRIDKIVNRAVVNLEFQDGTKTVLNCNIQDELAYKFKYDEYNAKPEMKCNTYSTSEKADLERRLSKAVSDAGYGTRAGVVEAARFLVGALDYKVPYLGPKAFDSSLGRYDRVGLNIANSNGWGCNVSGWKQGMDCTNFVIWAFKQNGLYPKGYYSDDYTYKTVNVVGNLQVGDFLLTPCDSTCYSSFQHIGIIIGIDNKYIYVAEATTGSIDAIVVTKYDKFDMPKKDKFSIAKLYKYAKEGNITNMWMSN